MPRNGGNAQDRRRARRAADRRAAKKSAAVATVSPETALEFEQLVAAANGSTLPELAETAAAPEALALERLDAFAEAQPSAPDLETRLDWALRAAAGDVRWEEDDGFLDLLCDVNEALAQMSPQSPDDEMTMSPRAIDLGIRLDKALVCDYDDDSYWVVPVSIGQDGETVIAPREQWTSVEERSQWVEVAADEADDDPADDPDPEAPAEMSRAAGTFASGGSNPNAANFRFLLQDFRLTDAGTANGGTANGGAATLTVNAPITATLTADGATAPELPAAHAPGERIPERTDGEPMVEEPSAAASGSAIAWTAKFVPEGTLTDDGRAFAPGALTWRELPLSLMAMIETSAEGGHDGAKITGRIDQIWREGLDIMASGVFDDGEFGQDIARMVGDGTLRGLSIDIAIHEYEVGPRSDYFDEDGSWRTDAPEASEDEAEPSLADLLFGGEDGEPRVFVVTDGVIGMATVCPFPAFAEASISLVASGGGAVWRYSHQAGFTAVRRPVDAEPAEAATLTVTFVPKSVTVEVKETGETLTFDLADENLDEQSRQAAYKALLEQGLSEAEARGTVWPEDEALTASAAGHAPVKPPAEWFEDPGFEELTALQIDEDGRIFGHAWSWDTCHLSFADACVVAPHSDTENAYYHLGEIECEDGEMLPVGKVTIDAPHAGQRLSRADATAHYDHTGTVAAHVRCGEDEFGGWVAGAIAPDLSEEKLRLLRGSVLSGDWRSVNGNLELVALLAVNVPGFPVPRALVASGDGEDGTQVLSLTAAGIVLERTEEDDLREIADLAREASTA